MPPAPLTLRSDTGAHLTAAVEHWDEREVVVVRPRPTDAPVARPRSDRTGSGADDTASAPDPSATPSDAAMVAAAAELALRRRVPLVVLLDSVRPDARLELDALHGLGRAARALQRCSGVVPVLAGLSGPLVGAPALLGGLVDQLVVGPDAVAYVAGPRSVATFTGEVTSAEALGGAAVLARTNGVAALVTTDTDIEPALADLVDLLPDNVDVLPPRTVTADPLDRPTPELERLLPEHPGGSYDVRHLLRSIVDDEDLLELREGWASNLVTALGRVGGQPIGLVANQPCSLAGTLDIAASQKGARFVAFCDAFNLPIVTVVDTPGFSPGKDLEWRGMIRHGSQLAFAYARATVPRVSLTVRKSYGGAYIVMDSKTMGNDVALAWPTAEIAVMGARGAAQILHRGADAERLGRVEAEYEARHLTPWLACERGLVDAVITPDDSRSAVAAALAMLATKRERLAHRPHNNMAL
ncbi:MAG: methylmalonyl-CoA carboxyltransferase [Acidimicrobiia bacterium]|nr:methylmalonyl-CoA carboxyltransferase [Acidimicrobiia bacterium]